MQKKELISFKSERFELFLLYEVNLQLDFWLLQKQYDRIDRNFYLYFNYSNDPVGVFINI
jgi:hypothetical protein